MINYDEENQDDVEPPAFETYVGKGVSATQLSRVINEEHIFAREKLISGAEVIIEIPPALNHVFPSHNSQNRISTPLFKLENQTHAQAKKISSAETEKMEFKNGTGDFCFFIHIRKPGLYSFSLNCMFDGLSAITDNLWQAKLEEWGKKHLQVGERVISLKLPDVAFSELMRHFFATSWCTDWLKKLDREITDSLCKDLNPGDSGQLKYENDHELGKQFNRTSIVLSEQLEDLIFMMGQFRAECLYGDNVYHNALPFDEKIDAWYLNAIFGMTSNLVVEPFVTYQPVSFTTHDPLYAVEKLCVLTNNLKSRADVVAYTGGEWELSNEETALAMIKRDTWISDGNTQTDNLIYQLQKVSDVINQVTNLLSKVTGGKWLRLIQQVMGLLSQLKRTESDFETELLLKPWRSYAVLPPEWSSEYAQAFRATTHTSSKVQTISHSDLISVTATDGATTTTRDATQRKVMSLFGDETARAIQQLVANAVGLTPEKLSTWLDKTLHTADDRSVQDQKISKNHFISEKEFLKLVKASKKFLPNYKPTLLAEK